MGLFGKTKLVDEETRPHSDATEEESPKDNTFLGIHFPTTRSEGPENATVSGTQSSTSPEELEDVGGRPPARTNPSTYSTIITTESGKNGRPGLQSTRFFRKMANWRNTERTIQKKRKSAGEETGLDYSTFDHVSLPLHFSRQVIALPLALLISRMTTKDSNQVSQATGTVNGSQKDFYIIQALYYAGYTLSFIRHELTIQGMYSCRPTDVARETVQSRHMDIHHRGGNGTCSDAANLVDFHGRDGSRSILWRFKSRHIVRHRSIVLHVLVHSRRIGLAYYIVRRYLS